MEIGGQLFIRLVSFLLFCGHRPVAQVFVFSVKPYKLLSRPQKGDTVRCSSELPTSKSTSVYGGTKNIGFPHCLDSVPVRGHLIQYVPMYREKNGGFLALRMVIASDH